MNIQIHNQNLPPGGGAARQVLGSDSQIIEETISWTVTGKSMMGSSCCAAGQSPLQSHLRSQEGPTWQQGNWVRRRWYFHRAVNPSVTSTSLSPVSYRQRLTKPSLQEKPVLLWSFSLTLPCMKLLTYSSVCTRLSRSSEAISGTHTYCGGGKSHWQQVPVQPLIH